MQEKQVSLTYFLSLKTNLEKHLMEMWSFIERGDGKDRVLITEDWSRTSFSLSITEESESSSLGMLGRPLIKSLTFTVHFKSPQKNMPVSWGSMR